MIQNKTLLFLSELKNNNHKTWFDNNRDRYQEARQDFEHFVQSILQELQKDNPSLLPLEPRNCMFRINRDIRFSKDKTPYKTNMAASIKQGGRKSRFAGYYFHIQPGGNSFAGGGMWAPASEDLKAVRQEIDYCLPEFKDILEEPEFKKRFQALEKEEGHFLINIPKGYEKENPAAEYLKFKSFFVNRPLSDAELTDKNLLRNVMRDFRTLTPLLDFLNRSIA